MTIAEIAGQIAHLVDRQAEAIVSNDFAQLEALTTETGRLIESLDAQVSGLAPDERARLVEILEPAAQRANMLVETATNELGQTRREIEDLRHGRSATNAYRQSVQPQAAISYSREG